MQKYFFQSCQCFSCFSMTFCMQCYSHLLEPFYGIRTTTNGPKTPFITQQQGFLLILYLVKKVDISALFSTSPKCIRLSERHSFETCGTRFYYHRPIVCGAFPIKPVSYDNTQLTSKCFNVGGGDGWRDGGDSFGRTVPGILSGELIDLWRSQATNCALPLNTCPDRPISIRFGCPPKHKAMIPARRTVTFGHVMMYGLWRMTESTVYLWRQLYVSLYG